MARTVRIFRYNPSDAGDSHFDSYQLEIASETTTTILDVLLRIQQEQDPTLSFRFACRVNMCGSCGMVIDGREALACKTNVSEIASGKEITIRPLNHFPVIKDLVVDMEPFFRKFEAVMPFFEPKDAGAEPARIAPAAAERLAIGNATECIACGCCVSSCTMVHDLPEYAGPAALNRAFTLIADSRDALHAARLEQTLASCYNCRTELNCTAVCPKGISPTHAIKSIQREAVIHLTASRLPAAPLITGGAAMIGIVALFLTGTSVGMLGVVAALLIAAFAWWNGRRHPVYMATGASWSAGLLYLALGGFAAVRPYNEPVPLPARTLTAFESRGLALYGTLGCAGCHQVLGRGGRRIGPDLANIAAKKRTADDLVRLIRKPGSSAMPAYSLPEPDLRALADFVLALGSSPVKTISREEVPKP
jgi:succinate dehydrogenase/fumarate reductase iron-sulfur protein